MATSLSSRNNSTKQVHRATARLEKLTIILAIVRAILFVWTGFHFVTMPIQAQNRPIFPVVEGHNIVGRVVVANTGAEIEAMAGVKVYIKEVDITTNLNKEGYFNITNIMNGKYTIQVIAEGSGEILSTQTIMLRGHDVHIPTIALERGDYVLCGRVTFADNRSVGVANVRVSLGNGLQTTTDSRGYYAFESLRYNSAYTLKVSLEQNSINANIGSNTNIGNAYVIYGAERTVKVSGAITKQNFVVGRNAEPAMANNDTTSGVEVGPLHVNTKPTLLITKTSAK